MWGNESGEEVCPRFRVHHCHIQRMLGIVVVAAGGFYGRRTHMQHELLSNCLTVTDHGVLFRRLWRV